MLVDHPVDGIAPAAADADDLHFIVLRRALFELEDHGRRHSPTARCARVQRGGESLRALSRWRGRKNKNRRPFGTESNVTDLEIPASPFSMLEDERETKTVQTKFRR